MRPINSKKNKLNSNKLNSDKNKLNSKKSWLYKPMPNATLFYECSYTKGLFG